MFKCDQCPSVFTAKHNLKVHQKKHVGVRFPCTVCPSTFSYKTGLNKHKKNFHGIVNVSARKPAQPIATPVVRKIVIQYAPPVESIQIAPQIFVPDVPAGGSNMLTEDEMCMEAMDEFEDTDSYTVAVNGKRVSTANTASAANAKRVRLNLVKSPGFVEILSSASRKIVWYYTKNLDNTMIYSEFLRPLIPELIHLLKTCVQKHAIKFNLKLEATYNRPNVPNSSENRAFKTIAVEIFPDSDIRTIVEIAYVKLMKEKDEYMGRGSGFTLESIDELLLSVYKYTPMGGSSYIELPEYIDRKRATINPQNIDQECFKWAILARHVTGPSAFRVEGENYKKHEGKYNFEGIAFPTPLSDITKFEKNNVNVSINVYGLDKKFQSPRKYPTYEVYPLRVVDEEKSNHFDMLLVTDGDNSHYTYISNFSRLVRAQKTGHRERVVFCKRCFTSFDNRAHKFKLSGQEALEQHKLICGAHKPILPEMPKEGDCVEFRAWKKTVRHPFVIYADFESLLVKTEEKRGESTTIIQKHEALSYGFLVKTSDNVPTELLIEHEIPEGAVIYRGSEDRTDIARHFVESIVDVARKIEGLIKTNIQLIMTEGEEKTHQECSTCNLCRCILAGGDKVRDHDHLTGKFRQTLCSRCNLELQQPKFVPYFP
ncbi:uncharacterized protein LOC132939667 [Metopolophium dirhodum]|uniref:uncharacterized protein LOC132939667 n=1 Tax=Metopolophium dirhodum TaxID=44670 RepID=UPI0029901E75|nr:uncharacterized protein LOC132939667 [Metopolophium dirhodum]